MNNVTKLAIKSSLKQLAKLIPQEALGFLDNFRLTLDEILEDFSVLIGISDSEKGREELMVKYLKKLLPALTKQILVGQAEMGQRHAFTIYLDKDQNYWSSLQELQNVLESDTETASAIGYHLQKRMEANGTSIQDEKYAFTMKALEKQGKEPVIVVRVHTYNFEGGEEEKTDFVLNDFQDTSQVKKLLKGGYENEQQDESTNNE